MQDLNAALSAFPMNDKHLPKLYLMTQEKLSLQQYEMILKNCAAQKVQIGVIFRHYESNRRQDFAVEFLRMAHEYGHLCLIAQDIDLAMQLQADGFHAPAYMASQTDYMQFIAQKCRARNPKWLMSGACHDMNEAENLTDFDLAFISPVQKTNSHPDIEPLDAQKLNSMLEILQKPNNIALGGVNFQDSFALSKLGFTGIAAVSAFKDTTS